MLPPWHHSYLTPILLQLFFFHRGSAIAKIVGANAKKSPNFVDRVTMYVYEEMIDGKKLTEIINTTHENVKYLPGHKLPENVVCSFLIGFVKFNSISYASILLYPSGSAPRGYSF